MSRGVSQHIEYIHFWVESLTVISWLVVPRLVVSWLVETLWLIVPRLIVTLGVVTLQVVTLILPYWTEGAACRRLLHLFNISHVGISDGKNYTWSVLTAGKIGKHSLLKIDLYEYRAKINKKQQL